MTLEQQSRLAAHIQRILKVRGVSFTIVNTDKGALSLKWVKDAPTFQVVLDAVPLNMNDYDNRELKSLLEKYLFDKEVNVISATALSEIRENELVVEVQGNIKVDSIVETQSEKKKRGRLAKSK